MLRQCPIADLTSSPRYCTHLLSSSSEEVVAMVAGMKIHPDAQAQSVTLIFCDATTPYDIHEDEATSCTSCACVSLATSSPIGQLGRRSLKGMACQD